ncbi:tetratricopeptide repeat protein [Microbacterium sp. MEC084]|jgi:putative thioredoxin|uniref:tetratricopeptide repeat protein n=1 Tax=unclassified Microbacterium TaxID=2609290 RepID=UPI0006F6661D|nr:MULTISPECIES: tetratricopeptide repeat protein [unclassified Microbacterium]KQY99262.1 thioredoxin [Microbacterium sp. Root53]MCD1269083.1 tetratricopeptide repeat protein [Microbacterium sp. MEC084]
MSDAAASPLSAAALRGAVDLSALKNRPAPGAPGAGQPPVGAAAGAPSVVFDATEQSFQEVLELSRRVPVVVALWSPRSGPVDAGLENAVRAQGGRLVLARVDVDANPQLLQAFRPQSIPMAVAIVAGQPVPLFAGPVPEDQLAQVFAQLLQLAAQNGVTGTVPVDGADEAPAEPPLPPLHAEAYAAIEVGDYDRAIAAYEKALKENPRDEEAQAGLGQVRLLSRVKGLDLQAARQAAAAAPTDVEAQLRVADLDIAGGHVDDAFDRLLELFAALPADERAPVRERLVELFGVVGAADPRVVRARGRLTSLLF